MVTVPFNEWLPGLPDHNNPGLVVADGVYRRAGAYHPMKGATIDAANDFKAFGSGSFAYDDFTVIEAASLNVAEGGNVARRFFALENDSSQISNVIIEDGGTLGIGDTSGLTLSAISDLVSYGANVYFIGDGDLYKSTLGSSLFAVVSGAGAPEATTLARVDDFLMAARRTSVSWSAFNNPEDWTASQRTLAGSAIVNVEELGEITQIVGGNIPLIFQTDGFSRLEFVGSPRVWDVREVSRSVGAFARSAVAVGDQGVVYFMGRHGDRVFVAKTNGAAVVDVSRDKLGDWLPDNTVSMNNSSSLRPWRVTYWPAQQQLVWAQSSGPGTHKFLAMSLETEEFTTFEGEHQAILGGPFLTDSDMMTAVASNGGDMNLAELSGSTLQATMTTGHMAATNAKRWTKTRSVEPAYEGAGATVALSAKAKLRDSANFGAYQPEDENGDFGIRSGGRSTAVSVQFPAASVWDDLTQVNVDIEDGGKR